MGKGTGARSKQPTGESLSTKAFPLEEPIAKSPIFSIIKRVDPSPSKEFVVLLMQSPWGKEMAKGIEEKKEKGAVPITSLRNLHLWEEEKGREHVMEAYGKGWQKMGKEKEGLFKKMPVNTVKALVEHCSPQAYLNFVSLLKWDHEDFAVFSRELEDFQLFFSDPVARAELSSTSTELLSSFCSKHRAWFQSHSSSNFPKNPMGEMLPWSAKRNLVHPAFFFSSFMAPFADAFEKDRGRDGYKEELERYCDEIGACILQRRNRVALLGAGRPLAGELHNLPWIWLDGFTRGHLKAFLELHPDGPILDEEKWLNIRGKSLSPKAFKRALAKVNIIDSL